MLRPVFVTTLLFSMAVGLDKFVSIAPGAGIKGWVMFILSAVGTGILMLLTSFFTGLSSDQRRDMLRRIRAVTTAQAT
jgi:hypothetical protein